MGVSHTQSPVGKSRNVQHFGYEFRYGTNDADLDNPLDEKIPDFIAPYIKRMITKSILFRKPEQLTVNHYHPETGTVVIIYKDNQLDKKKTYNP